MSISLIKEREKKVGISLKKRTNRIIQAEEVNLILDVSGSMDSAFHSGKVQEIVYRILPIATKLAVKQRLNVWIFSSSCKKLVPVDLTNYTTYVKDEIIHKGLLGGGTNYAPVIQCILDEYLNPPVGLWERIKRFFRWSKAPERAKLPVLNIMITDGNNDDKYRTEDVIIQASEHGLFWQFCGTYSRSFPFLERLDTLSQRRIDNANFFQVNDIADISDEELYDRLLGEFPSWIDIALREGIL